MVSYSKSYTRGLRLVRPVENMYRFPCLLSYSKILNRLKCLDEWTVRPGTSCRTAGSQKRNRNIAPLTSHYLIQIPAERIVLQTSRSQMCGQTSVATSPWQLHSGRVWRPSLHSSLILSLSYLILSGSSFCV